jgi:hypothetical protein
MFRSRWLGGFCLFAVSLSQTSCVVDSLNPLSDPAAAEVDSRLFGQWRHKEGNETIDYIIGRPPENSIKDCPPGLMVVYSFRRSAKGEVSGGGEPMYFFVSKIGKDDYLNLFGLPDGKRIEKWNREDLKSFFPVKYSVVQDRLTYWLMDLNATATVIESGKLKGNVTRKKITKDGAQVDGPIDGVHLTDASASLAKFLDGAGGQTLFADKEKTVMERVK